jgi:hypothetical protein
MAKPCRHCAKIFFIQSDLLAEDNDSHPDHVDDYSPVRHHGTVEDLIKSANTCCLCSAIEKSWSLPRLLAKFPDIKYKDFGSLELTWKLTDAASCGRDVVCNFLSGDIISPFHGYSDTFKLTIMTCRLESTSSPFCFITVADTLSRSDKSSCFVEFLAQISHERKEPNY